MYEDSLSEIALSDSSKLASTYFSLFHRSVHVLYTGIEDRRVPHTNHGIDNCHFRSIFKKPQSCKYTGCLENGVNVHYFKKT